MKFKKNLLLSKLNSTKRKSSSLIRRTISVVCTAVISFSTLSVCTAANVSAAAANEKNCIYFYTDSTLYNAYQNPGDLTKKSQELSLHSSHSNGNNAIDASVASTILYHYANVQSGGKGIL